MNKSIYTEPYKCLKDFVCDGDTAKCFTRGLVYNSYYTRNVNHWCFINNQGLEHILSHGVFVEYFADVNYQLELL